MTDEQIIKALECCKMPVGSGACNTCPLDCQREKRLTSSEKSCTTLLFDYTLDLINLQRSEIDELTRDTIPELRASLERANKYGIEADKENKRLNAEIDRLHNILLSFASEIHFWSNKYGYDTTELSLIPILNEAESVREVIKAEAVKEFAERLKEKASMYTYGRGEEHDGAYVNIKHIDNLVKEMVGEQKMKGGEQE